jgi:hypothetical protein
MFKRAQGLIAAGALTLGVVQPVWATVQIVPPGSDVAGQSQLYWAQAWWQWAMGIPQPNSGKPLYDPLPPYNPLNDQTGQYAGANNNGPVFFLAGNAIAGGVWTRTITVPFGKPVFFPVLNAFYVPINQDGTYGPDPCETPLTLACALTVPPSYLVGANMTVQIDNGTPLHTAQIEPFRQTSTSYFSVALPADNVLEVTPINNYDQCVATGVGQPCSDLWVQDGFYITLDDLSVGTHTLQFQGETAAGFSLDVTDTLIVTIPEPSTWAMMALGFAGLAYAGWRSGRGTR